MVDLLNESFFEGQAAIAAFERPDELWGITVHFTEPPDQTSIRELVGLAAGDEVARGIAFDTVEAMDWVKATLEELVPRGGASSCTASMTAPRFRATSSASRSSSRRRWRSASAITAPRPARELCGLECQRSATRTLSDAHRRPWSLNRPPIASGWRESPGFLCPPARCRTLRPVIRKRP